MKRRIDLILRSLGSEKIRDPGIKELAGWIAGQKGSCGDLISYKIEKSLVDQKKADIPCTGGMFYSKRMHESIGGLKSGGLGTEPYPVSAEMSHDAERVRKIRKGCYLALPSPSSLGISDYYFNDYSDFISAICEVYRKLMREQRDRGIKGHIIVSDRFSSTELEDLSGSKAFFFSPSGSSKVLSSILEFQNSIAVYPEKLGSLTELMPEYDLRSVTIVDPGEGDLERILSDFDPEAVYSGGYCRDCDKQYWDRLKEGSFAVL